MNWDCFHRELLGDEICDKKKNGKLCDGLNVKSEMEATVHVNQVFLWVWLMCRSSLCDKAARLPWLCWWCGKRVIPTDSGTWKCLFAIDINPWNWNASRIKFNQVQHWFPSTQHSIWIGIFSGAHVDVPDPISCSNCYFFQNNHQVACASWPVYMCIDDLLALLSNLHLGGHIFTWQFAAIHLHIAICIIWAFVFCLFWRYYAITGSLMELFHIIIGDDGCRFSCH